MFAKLKLVVILILSFTTTLALADIENDMQSLEESLKKGNFKAQMSLIQQQHKQLKTALKNFSVQNQKLSKNELTGLIAYEEILQRLNIPSPSLENCKSAEVEINFIDSTTIETQKSKEAQRGLRMLELICKK